MRKRNWDVEKGNSMRLVPQKPVGKMFETKGCSQLSNTTAGRLNDSCGDAPIGPGDGKVICGLDKKAEVEYWK